MTVKSLSVPLDPEGTLPDMAYEVELTFNVPLKVPQVDCIASDPTWNRTVAEVDDRDFRVTITHGLRPPPPAVP